MDYAGIVGQVSNYVGVLPLTAGVFIMILVCAALVAFTPKYRSM